MADETLSAQQPALDGLAVKKRSPAARKRAEDKARMENAPADDLPIARVVLEVQTPHLGQLFDYIVPQKLSKTAQPGTLIRARFGNRRCTGVIWERVADSTAPRTSLKTIERVLSSQILINAHMRAEIEAIADFFGGSRANIVRLAVPPRVAKVEKELSLSSRSSVTDELAKSIVDYARNGERELAQMFGTQSIADVMRALNVTTMYSHIVWDTLPGVGSWERDLTWMVAAARMRGRQVVVVLPDMCHVEHLVTQLQSIGLSQFSDDNLLGTWKGNFVVLNASLPAADRYRSYLAIAEGLVGCVIGTRAAMYAPVGKNAVYITLDESVYQNWDGFTPYPNVHDVVRIRAQRSNSVVITAGNVRSSQTQWLADKHPQSIIEVHGLNAVIAERSAWIRHLNREELERLADPAIGARVPSTAVSVLRKAAEKGPVLLSIPARSQSAVLCCSSCRKVAQCRRCLGPLKPDNETSNGHPMCQWCGAVALDWSCLNCGNTSMRLLHIGTEGTAQELSTLIQGVPIIMSTPEVARGVVEEISDRPALVIATPGAEPRVRNRETDELQGYRSVAIIDAWTSLYGSSLDQRIDTLRVWSDAAALCVPRVQGGQVLILGEADSVIVSSLLSWDSRILANREIRDAEETGLPPSVSAAVIWGEKASVERMVEAVREQLGGLPVIETRMGALPSLLGPVPKAIPQNLRQYYIDALYQRVQCVIRVPREELHRLVVALHQAQARHTAQRNPAELHFHVNPKNVM